MKIGVIGLGNMGLSMVKSLRDHGHEVFVWDRSVEPRFKAVDMGAMPVEQIRDIAMHLNKEQRKVIVFMVSDGSVVDQLLFENGVNSIINVLTKGDIFIDCTNPSHQDAQRRAKRLGEKGIFLLDAEIKGGIEGVRYGAECKVEENQTAFDYVEQIFKDLSVVDGYSFTS